MPKRKPIRSLSQISCFMACGFGYEDVDWFFDRIVVPVLAKAAVEAVRVDRIEHNGNIDDQIEARLQQADLVLADLTYARPSVYFEAGVAEGMRKPVIFTARSDHFKDLESDPNGHLRVHFDLKMRNIIGWTKTGSVMPGRKRLARRVAHVLKPILRQRSINSKAAAARQEFASLSPQERGRRIEKAAIRLLSEKRFREVKRKAADRWSRGGVAMRSSGRTHRAEIILLQSESWPQQKMWILGSAFVGLADRPSQWSGKQCAVHVIGVSRRAVGAQSLDRGLPHYEPVPADGIQVRRYLSDEGLRTLTMIDRVDSVEDFEQRLNRAITKLIGMRVK